MRGSAIISNAAIALSHGTILAIGPAEKIIKQHPGHRIHFLKNTVLLPGLVNTHPHLELPPLLNAIRAKAFPDWVLNLIKSKKELGFRDYAAAVKKYQTLNKPALRNHRINRLLVDVLGDQVRSQEDG